MSKQSIQKFVVIPLSLSGMGNKIFKNGDVVTGEQVAVNGRTVDGLIKDGFIKPLDENGDKKEAESNIKTDVKNDEPKEIDPIFTTEDGKAVHDIKDCTTKEIKAELTKRNIEFDSKENKNALFQKLQ